MLAMLCYVCGYGIVCPSIWCVRVYLYLLSAGLTYLWLYACSTRITLHYLWPNIFIFMLQRMMVGRSGHCGPFVPRIIHNRGDVDAPTPSLPRTSVKGHNWRPVCAATTFRNHCRIQPCSAHAQWRKGTSKYII